MKTAEERLIAARQSAQEQHLRVRGLIDREAEERYLESKMGPARGPTEETKEKLQTNNIEYLTGRGVITDDQERALSRIHDGFDLIVFGVRIRLSSPERVDNGGEPSEYSPREVSILRDYRRWREAVNAAQFRITIDVAVAGMTFAEIEASRKLTRRTVKELLLDSLEQYRLVWEANRKLDRKPPSRDT